MKVKTKYKTMVPKGWIGTVIDEDRYSYLVEFDNFERFAFGRSQVEEVEKCSKS
ncbi:hypothetical protein S101189_01158 [Pediococcus acidilactici]|uniref:hypothetical protein n=1 Tax=Pediococcus acidilactici TaxID=1254 RepID=UPI00080235A1|nr:hypothetical protein [Pediococcus acidilactici]ARW24594.1 hypothetical protein S100424_01158 [Pediococcus acidilactici]ARW26636.1 hypothetical protein S100313_01201 [Pediococcus acidilactici]ARW28712.1 hypothetical protein S101189_01158 [Pediococcus acidilactici]OBR30909.1 hypothetical protein SRCM100320_00402 [Pediococcus acidilactici]